VTGRRCSSSSDSIGIYNCRVLSCLRFWGIVGPADLDLVVNQVVDGEAAKLIILSAGDTAVLNMGQINGSYNRASNP